MGGHTGQGGFGLPSRAWGLLADQITSLEIVTADGSIRTASPTENADLFWAATGAGASFGIITSFTAETHAALDSIAFAYTFANYGAAEASKGLQAWQTFANDPVNKLDTAVGLQIHVNPGSSPSGVVFSVSGVYCECTYPTSDLISAHQPTYTMQTALTKPQSPPPSPRSSPNSAPHRTSSSKSKTGSPPSSTSPASTASPS